jgi:predicted esterase
MAALPEAVMDRRRALALVAAALVAGAPPAAAKGKPAAPAPPADAPKGKSNLEDPPGYVRMGVPDDYDASKWWPLFFLLSPGGQKPDDWADAWSEVLPAKGWIVAAPYAMSDWENEGSVEPLKAALRRVQARYRIDDRRIVIAGHIAGANMAFRMAVVEPDLFAAVVGMNGGVPNADLGMIKRLAGKRVFLFSGEKDGFYSPDMLQRDASQLEFAKALVTKEVRPAWGNDFSRQTVPKVAEWLAEVWPAGAYREKASALEAAVAKKDFAAGQAALKDLRAELKKNPYPAFEGRAQALEAALFDAGRALVADARRFLDEEKPLVALERAEAAVKAVKGLKPVDAEAAAALAALRKDPKVLAALAQKKAEDQASTYMERAAAAEGRNDLGKALDWYRKAAALETSQKAEAERKVTELEALAGLAAGMETR